MQSFLKLILPGVHAKGTRRGVDACQMLSYRGPGSTTSAAFSSARMLHSMLKGLERSQDTTAETFMSGRMESAISTTRSVAVVENVKTWLN